MKCARMYLSSIFMRACNKRDYLLIEDVAPGPGKVLEDESVVPSEALQVSRTNIDKADSCGQTVTVLATRTTSKQNRALQFFAIHYLVVQDIVRLRLKLQATLKQIIILMSGGLTEP